MSTDAVLDVTWSCEVPPPGWRIAEARVAAPPSWSGGPSLPIAMSVGRRGGHPSKGLYVVMVHHRWSTLANVLEEELARVHGFSAPSDIAHRLLGLLLVAVPPDHAAVVASAGARASAALLWRLGQLPDSLYGLLAPGLP